MIVSLLTDDLHFGSRHASLLLPRDVYSHVSRRHSALSEALPNVSGGNQGCLPDSFSVG